MAPTSHGHVSADPRMPPPATGPLTHWPWMHACPPLPLDPCMHPPWPHACPACMHPSPPRPPPGPSGSFAVVELCEYYPAGGDRPYLVAVKRIKQRQRRHEEQSMLNEVALLRRLNNRQVHAYACRLNNRQVHMHAGSTTEQQVSACGCACRLNNRRVHAYQHMHAGSTTGECMQV